MARDFRRLLPIVLALLLATLPGCGGGSSPASGPVGPFVAEFPPDGPGPGETPPTTPPPDETPTPPIFDASAFVHGRGILYGAFPSDVVLHDQTVFTTDGDQITAEGAWVTPLDVSGPAPFPSTRYTPFQILARDLVDSAGTPADIANPIGFGFFLNDVLVVDTHLALVLVNAGGSDNLPTLSNLVAFDPTTGTLRQVIDLTHSVPVQPGMLDSSGVSVPPSGFVQSGAEAMAYMQSSTGAGRVYVAMTNLIYAPPSSGTVKYPATIQVFDVQSSATVPVTTRSGGGSATEVLLPGGYNPVALTVIEADRQPWQASVHRLLVTVAGATAYDASWKLVPVTDASVVALDLQTGTQLGRFLLGLTGLAATRPAIGRDAAGHRVGFFPSAVTGEVYLLRLDGLYDVPVDSTRLAVLRGPNNGIPIASASAGGPGANITSAALAPDGRTLVVAGFGDLFAFPEPLPGRLYLLGLPEDVVTGSSFGADFTPGSSLYGTAPGRALGAVALVPNGGSRPDVYVAVSSPIDPHTFLATGSASLGTLQTFGMID